ncbi:MAG: FtsX-like permease family protein [Gemmatimonadales bacterium]|nr:MAG: FtsX-like permease family protein [Gemmatimonadales bacterium]
MSDSEGVGTGALERALRADHPNVSWVDVSTVRETVERIASRVLQVLAALTAFVVAGGVLVLLAALLSGRYYRRREAALLRTLGARGRRVRAVFMVEYAALGALAGLAGLLLGAGGGILLLHFGFDLAGTVPWLRLAAVWAGTVVLVVAAGWLTAGPVLRAPPVVVLREAEG